MNVPKFTPGPWRVGTPNVSQFASIGIHALDDGSDWVIADVCADVPRGIDQRANANLIAAAPAGYDAGERLLDVVLAAIGRGDWRVDGSCDPDMAISGMRRFLDKARGEGA